MSQDKPLHDLCTQFAQLCESALTGGEVGDIGFWGEKLLNGNKHSGLPQGIASSKTYVTHAEALQKVARKDMEKWKRFALESLKTGSVSYAAACEYTGKSYRSLKRAVSKGQIEKIGRSRPAKLSPESVIRFAFNHKSPLNDLEREVTLLWRLLFSSLNEPDERSIPTWPSVSRSDRWEILDCRLAYTHQPPPKPLVCLLRGYSANEIALITAFQAMLFRKKFKPKASFPEVLRWRLFAGDYYRTEIESHLSSQHFLCPHCRTIGKHTDSRTPEDKKRSKRPGTYTLECPSCSKAWEERLIFEDYKGAARKNFTALNTDIPPKHQLSEDVFRRYQNYKLMQFKYRTGDFAQCTSSELASAMKV